MVEQGSARSFVQYCVWTEDRVGLGMAWQFLTALTAFLLKRQKPSWMGLSSLTYKVGICYVRMGVCVCVCMNI